MGRDWTGNKATTFVTLAASNHSAGERGNTEFLIPFVNRVCRLILNLEFFLLTLSNKGNNRIIAFLDSKFLFSANNIPRIKDRTGAVLDRLIIIPFNAQFPLPAS